MPQSGSDISPERSTCQPPKLPPGWEDAHTRFVQDLANKGEDVASTVILFETEFPHVKLAQEVELGDVVKEIMAETQ